MQHLAVLLEGRHVAERGLGDVGHGLFREERLVAGDEHVGKGQQPREGIVLNDVAGQVLEEEIAFLLGCSFFFYPVVYAQYAETPRVLATVDSQNTAATQIGSR